MTAPKVGDRVRVVIEGVFRAGTDSGTRFVGGGDGTVYVTSWGLRSAAAVEVLPPPEPVWQAWDVVRTASKFVVIRDSVGEGWRFADGSYRADTEAPLTGPLTLLVRDGKPVQS